MSQKNGDKSNKFTQITVNLDTTPVLYTDNINMTTGVDGVVLDVIQRLGTTNKVRVVARIGMSREHALKLVDKLSKLLLKSQGIIATGRKVKH